MYVYIYIYIYICVCVCVRVCVCVCVSEGWWLRVKFEMLTLRKEHIRIKKIVSYSQS